MTRQRDKDDQNTAEQPGTILGITRDVTPDPGIATDRDEPDTAEHRRAADDLAHDTQTDRDSLGASNSPPGLHVAD